MERMKARRLGDPLEDGVDVGPQARTDLRDELHEQVAKSVAAGARVLLGGEEPAGRAPSIPPPCSRGSRRACPRTTRSCSARWRPSLR